MGTAPYSENTLVDCYRGDELAPSGSYWEPRIYGGSNNNSYCGLGNGLLGNEYKTGSTERQQYNANETNAWLDMN